jgi:hypothetical protein
MVVSTCKHCKQYHLIADNERKLDMGQDYGERIDEFLQARGETVQRLSVSRQELEEYYLVDKDGVLSMVPKAAGQVSCVTSRRHIHVEKTLENLALPVLCLPLCSCLRTLRLSNTPADSDLLAYYRHWLG